MNLSDEIRKQIEKNKGLKLAVGEINNHLSTLEGLVRKDIEERKNEAYQKGYDAGIIASSFVDKSDEAYQRGFEDGKAQLDRGCEGCKYTNKELTCPCSECSNNYKNQWTAKQTDDEIKVGDEVERYIDGKFDSKGIYLNDADEKGDYWNCLFWTGACFVTLGYPKNQFKKTGRHFDIASILKEMQS